MNTKDIRAIIQDKMRSIFPEAEQRVTPFYAMQEYHLGWRDTDFAPAHFDPGKLLRPQLAIRACESAGGSMQQALPLAAAIQLIHDFTLIHDDIEDDSDTRRGRVTVWKQWGLAQGINAGDGMFSLAHLALYQLLNEGISPEIIIEVYKRFDQTVLTICEGQYLDLSFEGNLRITEDDYLSMISRKTAALIAASSGLGTLVGGGDPESVQASFEFGESLGLSFQIQDDVIGIWGDPAVTGKPRAADIYRRKVSMPIVHALRNAPNREELEAVYRKQDVSDEDVDLALAVLETAGSRAYTEGMAQTYHEKAVQALEHIRPKDSSEAQEAFGQIQAMLEMLLGRKS